PSPPPPPPGKSKKVTLDDIPQVIIEAEAEEDDEAKNSIQDDLDDLESKLLLPVTAARGILRSDIGRRGDALYPWLAAVTPKKVTRFQEDSATKSVRWADKN